MRAICFGFDFKKLLCGYNNGISFGENNTKYSLQMSVLRIHLLAGMFLVLNLSTNIENKVTISSQMIGIFQNSFTLAFVKTLRSLD